METLVTQYELEDSKGLWLTIVDKFGEHISKNGVPYFKGDSSAERDFIHFCHEQGLGFRRKTFLEHSGNDPLGRRFYFLRVKDLGDYEQEFIEFACDGGGKGMCWRGARQVRKVDVSQSRAKSVQKNGIVVKNYPISPCVYLVSRELREVLQRAAFTGLTFVPCLNSDEEYSPEEVAFPTLSSRLETDAPCFQLVIQTKTVGLPSIGKLIVASRCPRCGAASILDGTQYFHFRKADLAEADFQFFSDVIAENAGEIPMVGEVAIISGRALQFLRDGGVKGLKAYLTDPPIKFAVVAIDE